MATIHGIPSVEKPPISRQPTNGADGGKNLVPGDSRARSVKDYSPPPTSTAVWVLIAAIVMSFAAFSSALIVRQGASFDWRHLAIPRILYLNTVVLILSSIALGKARRRFANFRISTVGGQFQDARQWLYAAVVLGVLFVAGQFVAWMQLRAQGIYLATNPNSSFFYVLTVAHAVHIVGGLCALAYVIHKLTRGTLQRNTLDAVSRYWHFVDLLWVYLLFLLLFEM